MKKNKILIVDDEQILRSSLARVLKNYDISSASSGEEAVQIASKQKFDLALVDIIMPGMGGIKTIEELKNINKQIKVIAMTAYGTVEGAVEAMKVGAFHYLTKPFDIEETLLLVENALESGLREIANSQKIIDLSRSKKKIVWQSEEMQEIFDLIE